LTLAGTHHEYTDLGAGRYLARFHLGAIAYRDGGTLYPVLRDWQDSGIPARPHIVTAAPFFVSVADDGLRRIHPTREIDRYFEIGAPCIKVAGDWTKIALGTPDRTGPLLTWTRTNANVYVRMTGHSVKFGILLKNGWIPQDNQFAFPVGLTGFSRSGGVILDDGAPVMRIARPHVYDLDNPDDWHPLPLQFVQVADQWYTLFTLPAAVASMSRPLIDPTLQSYAPTVDTFMDSSDATADHSGDSWLSIRYYTTPYARRPILKWDLSSIASGSTINSADLQLTLQSGFNSNEYIDCHRTTVYTPTNAACWDNYDGSNAWGTGGGDMDGTATDSAYTDGTHDSAGETHIFDVSADVQDFVDGVETDHGWILKWRSESSPNKDGKYEPASASTQADRPCIVIDYTEPAASGYPVYAYQQQ